MIITKNHNEMEPVINPNGIKSWKLYDSENAQVVHLQLEKGESLKPHITPVNVFFYVLEGKGSVLVGEERIQVTAGTLVESPKDIVHCLYNDGDTVFRVLVNKVPRPAATAK